MTTTEKLLEYASKHNDGDRLTDQQWLGQAITEGIVISRTPSTRIIVNIRREGKEIIVTETSKIEQAELVNKQRVYTETEKEVMRLTV